jgi:glycosyltransferase involved in cell wall biosynthesis
VNDNMPPLASGAGRAVWGLAAGLRGLGHEISVLSASSMPDRRVRDGIELRSIRARTSDRWRSYLSLYNPTSVKAFSRELAEIAPDLVHVHNVHEALSYGCIRAAHGRGYPVLFTAHDVMSFAYGKLAHYVDRSACPKPVTETYRLPRWHNLKAARLRYNPIRDWAIRSILRDHVDAKLAVSDVLRVALQANGLGPFELVYPGAHSVGNPVDSAVLREIQERLGTNGRPTVLMAGRVGKAKGIEQALAALERVLVRVPTAVMVVLSDRPVDLGMHAWDLEGYVVEGGWLDGDALSAAYQLADVVICPSICLDSFSLVALEAMSAGKPVVASCHGGYPESVIDGVTGFIVNPFDSKALADKIGDLLTKPDLSAELGTAGLQRYRSSFTPRNYAERMEAVYSRFLA